MCVYIYKYVFVIAVGFVRLLFCIRGRLIGPNANIAFAAAKEIHNFRCQLVYVDKHEEHLSIGLRLSLSMCI